MQQDVLRLLGSSASTIVGRSVSSPSSSSTLTVVDVAVQPLVGDERAHRAADQEHGDGDDQRGEHPPPRRAARGVPGTRRVASGSGRAAQASCRQAYRGHGDVADLATGGWPDGTTGVEPVDSRSSGRVSRTRPAPRPADPACRLRRPPPGLPARPGTASRLRSRWRQSTAVTSVASGTSSPPRTAASAGQRLGDQQPAAGRQRRRRPARRRRGRPRCSTRSPLVSAGRGRVRPLGRDEPVAVAVHLAVVVERGAGRRRGVPARQAERPEAERHDVAGRRPAPRARRTRSPRSSAAAPAGGTTCSPSAQADCSQTAACQCGGRSSATRGARARRPGRPAAGWRSWRPSWRRSPPTARCARRSRRRRRSAAAGRGRRAARGRAAPAGRRRRGAGHRTRLRTRPRGSRPGKMSGCAHAEIVKTPRPDVDGRDTGAVCTSPLATPVTRAPSHEHQGSRMRTAPPAVLLSVLVPLGVIALPVASLPHAAPHAGRAGVPVAAAARRRSSTRCPARRCGAAPGSRSRPAPTRRPRPAVPRPAGPRSW